MKELILKLYAEGKSYNTISKELGCSKGSVSYHCGKGQKEKGAIRQSTRRKKNVLIAKCERFNYVSARKSLENRIDAFQRNENERVATFTWQQVVDKIGENPTCYLTGRKIDLSSPKSYSFDHIVPTCKGGSNDLDNLGLTCKEANLSKAALSLEEFVQLCKEVLETQGYNVSK